jgi:hypothetical protein
MAWRKKFKQEMEALAKQKAEDLLADEKKRRGGAKDEVKLTGRQLWEGGLAGKGEDDGDDDGIDALASIEKLKVTS